MTTDERPAEAENTAVHAEPDARAHAERARLEAEVARRKAASPARAEPAQAAREPGQIDARIFERARQAQERARAAGNIADPHPEDADVPKGETEQQTRARLAARVRTEAWHNSLAAASLSRLGAHTLDGLDESQYPDVLRKYVDNLHTGDVLNLVLAGPVGGGKTAAAVALGSYAASTGRMVRVVRHSAYLAWLRPDGAGPDMPEWKVRARFRDADLLILDDLGAELDRGQEASRHVRDETLGLIGDRVASGKGTVVTTNETSAVLEAMLGERVMSRLADQGAALVVKHEDRRRASTKNWF